MKVQMLPLSQWTNGVIMIAIFGLVCVFLIAFLVKSMTSSDRKKDKEVPEK